MSTDPSDEKAPPQSLDLPPVEPPGAKFIIQLFVVPAIIVAAIVSVWFLFIWASGTEDPNQYVAALNTSGPSRWQAASSLADILRQAEYKEFKLDPEPAKKIVALLDREIKLGEVDKATITDPKRLTLRAYLCAVLGEFYVDDGLEVLLVAAKTEREPKEIDVRTAALEAIALLAGNPTRPKGPWELTHPELKPTLLKLAEDTNPEIRKRVAYLLGVLNQDDLNPTLAELASDTYPDVRYNAATGLARQGDERAIPVLLEMLDPTEQRGLEIEKNEALREEKQFRIMINAMRATDLLRKKNRAVDISPLIEAIKDLSRNGSTEKLRMNAEHMIHIIQKPQDGAADTPGE